MYPVTTRVPEEDLLCQCISSIFPPGAHQLYANVLALLFLFGPILYYVKGNAVKKLNF